MRFNRQVKRKVIYCLTNTIRIVFDKYFEQVLRALTQILRHIEVSCDATSSVSDNGESSLSRLNTCRKNYVTFVTNLVKIQAGTLYQVPVSPWIVKRIKSGVIL